jgi:hypothetical protein
MIASISVILGANTTMSVVCLRGRQHVMASLDSLSQLASHAHTNDKGKVVGYFNNEAAAALDIIFNLDRCALEDDAAEATATSAEDAFGQGETERKNDKGKVVRNFPVAGTTSPDSEPPAYDLQSIENVPDEFKSKSVRNLRWPLTGGEAQRQSMRDRRKDHFVKTPFEALTMFVLACVHLSFDCMLVSIAM